MGVHKGFFALFSLAVLWLGGKYLLPLIFPFLLGLGIALAAEPVVKLSCRQLGLRRGPAAGLGVTVTLVLLAGLLVILGALLLRQTGKLVDHAAPMVSRSAALLEAALTQLSQKAPYPVGPILTNSVQRFFHNGTVLADRAAQQLPGLLSGVLSKLSGSAMGLGTGVLSGYFFSARLPRLKQLVQDHLPAVWFRQVQPGLRQLRVSLGSWLTAQGKLMSITYGIVTLGLLILGIPYAFAWALLVAAVDAVPVLGTGTVLLPWALTRLLQGDLFTAAGLLVIYLTALVTRTVLEPRFYGKHLGVDPLLMLVFLYFGYRFWGFWGIVISPLLAAATKALTEK